MYYLCSFLFNNLYCIYIISNSICLVGRLGNCIGVHSTVTYFFFLQVRTYYGLMIGVSVVAHQLTNQNTVTHLFTKWLSLYYLHTLSEKKFLARIIILNNLCDFKRALLSGDRRCRIASKMKRNDIFGHVLWLEHLHCKNDLPMQSKLN